jgi:nucleoside-diphosphate-sugar epimerase
MALHVVVTGAGGFVGGFLARWLAAKNFDVTAVIRRPVAGGDDDVTHIHWINGDLRQPDMLPKRFDSLLHCAAEIPQRIPDGDVLYRANIDLSRNVFDQAMAAGAGSVVYLSSMSAYGQVSVPVVTEELPPHNLDAYGRAKRDVEALLEASVQGGLYSGLTIRLPGTVGKGSHHNFLSEAWARIAKDETVQARNANALFNNIVYVGDLAEFLHHWILKPRKGYTVTNLAATEPLPFCEVFELLFACAAKEQRINYSDGGKPPFLIELNRAISLGYSPSTVRASIKAFVRDNLGE